MGFRAAGLHLIEVLGFGLGFKVTEDSRQPII